MKHHIMISMGILMAAIFSYRLANALVAPGFGGLELYLFGGIILAGWLIFAGLKERRAARSSSDKSDH